MWLASCQIDIWDGAGRSASCSGLRRDGGEKKPLMGRPSLEKGGRTGGDRHVVDGKRATTGQGHMNLRSTRRRPWSGGGCPRGSQ